ncbi:HNH endonuclease [Deinococcus planocerae]|uniref:HNH endonuclease n=1 Tax=Deinococcus planocerae TaxID=1737569 RepID=UPI001C63EE60|nr:HNH endonuclease [Deinococcus planocerae]
MKRRKTYRKVRDRATGRSVLLHRRLAAEMLGRPLLSGEIVHHRDGNSTNNARENLLVLPSQRYHAHVEYHLRCEKRGMSSLFPELLSSVKEERPGTLFEGVLPHQEGASRLARREHQQRTHSPLRDDPRQRSWG